VDKTWRFRLQSSVDADAHLVFAWFVDTERRADRRRFFERFDTRDFRWQEQSEGDVHGIVAAWTTTRGTRIDLRITEWSDRDALTQKLNISQARIHFDGREDHAESESTLQCRPEETGGTDVTMLVAATRHNYRWSAVSPLARYYELQHRSRHFHEGVARCSAAIQAGCGDPERREDT
jgi:hypothetical protein